MKSSAKKNTKKAAAPEKPQPPIVMPLGAVNYLFIALGAAVIGLSYAFMYLEKQVDGLFSLHIAPFTLVGAYLWVLYAIFYRPKGNKKSGTP
jgi:uncharacterized membrane-anchored protein